jgi:hypothetical protein
MEVGVGESHSMNTKFWSLVRILKLVLEQEEFPVYVTQISPAHILQSLVHTKYIKIIVTQGMISLFSFCYCGFGFGFGFRFGFGLGFGLDLGWIRLDSFIIMFS